MPRDISLKPQAHLKRQLSSLRFNPEALCGPLCIIKIKTRAHILGCVMGKCQSHQCWMPTPYPRDSDPGLGGQIGFSQLPGGSNTQVGLLVP